MQRARRFTAGASASGRVNSTDAAQWMTCVTSRATRARLGREPKPGCVTSPATASTRFSQPGGWAAKHGEPTTSLRRRASACSGSRARTSASTRSMPSSSRRRSSVEHDLADEARGAGQEHHGRARALIRCRRRTGSPDRPTALSARAQRQRRRREDARQERLAQLADAVVVRERAARAQDLVARGALELGVHLARVLDALVVEREVEVDADARLVELRHAAADERRAGQARASRAPARGAASRSRTAPAPRSTAPRSRTTRRGSSARS